jgi:N-acetylglucosaminyldiphosphoundecaprenol N-acetyl-beta-D-mannosaminyltransferase
MEKFFSIPFEFNKEEVLQKIEDSVKKENTGYVCVVDSNMLAFVNSKNNDLGIKIVGSSLVNICDSSYLPILIKFFHKQKYKNYTGSELFFNLLNSNYYTKYLFLGSTNNILMRLKKRLMKIKDYKDKDFYFMDLPFKNNVMDFDFIQISQKINNISPEIIFLSLGAPKQEEFMYRIRPLLNKSVMIGVGAVFQFYSGIKRYQRSPKIIQNLKLEWFYRYFQEPSKQIKRDLFLIKNLPNILINEKKRLQKK